MSEQINYQAIFGLPCARLGIRIENEALVALDFLPPGGALLKPTSALAWEVCAQLAGYSRDPDFEFDLPLQITGTAYQQRVWQALRAIPRGTTLSYGKLAAQLASGPRAIGRACGDNRLPVIIPCHRVISQSGPGGFMHHAAGAPLAIKAWLLQHEGWRAQ